jgi:hypothetical protein
LFTLRQHRPSEIRIASISSFRGASNPGEIIAGRKLRRKHLIRCVALEIVKR